MTATTLKTVWHGAVKLLKDADIDTPVADARLLVQHVLGLSHEELLMHGARPVTADEQQKLDAVLQRRLSREPVSRIVGHRAFWKGDFIVTADTLDPRADSETLIEAALAHARTPLEKVLDLGTGTGCLLISLLQEWPQATGVGLDISAGAADVARRNAEVMGVAARSEIAAMDWAQYRPGMLFDVVVSNPPYIAEDETQDLAPEVLNHDPHVALFAGGGGLDAYRSILVHLDLWLKPGGLLIVETGYRQAATVAQLMRGAGLDVRETRNDLGGHPRVVVAQKSRVLLQ